MVDDSTGDKIQQEMTQVITINALYKQLLGKFDQFKVHNYSWHTLVWWGNNLADTIVGGGDDIDDG